MRVRVRVCRSLCYEQIYAHFITGSWILFWCVELIHFLWCCWGSGFARVLDCDYDANKSTDDVPSPWLASLYLPYPDYWLHYYYGRKGSIVYLLCMCILYVCVWICVFSFFTTHFNATKNLPTLHSIEAPSIDIITCLQACVFSRPTNLFYCVAVRPKKKTPRAVEHCAQI